MIHVHVADNATQKYKVCLVPEYNWIEAVDGPATSTVALRHQGSLYKPGILKYILYLLM